MTQYEQIMKLGAEIMNQEQIAKESALYRLMDEAAHRVMEERYRQNRKWGVQRHNLTKWLAILVEEVGEFAQALQTGMESEKATDAHDTLGEIIQVAAVAQAIAEQLIEKTEK